MPVNDYQKRDDYAGYEWSTHPCRYCGTYLSDSPGPDGWPYAYCHTCRENEHCQHGVLLKDECNRCDVLPE